LHELVFDPRQGFCPLGYRPSLGIEVLGVAAVGDQEVLEVPIGRAVTAVEAGAVLHRTGAAAVPARVDERAQRTTVEAAVELPPFGDLAPAFDRAVKCCQDCRSHDIRVSRGAAQAGRFGHCN
jgi:hypothetical protein